MNTSHEGRATIGDVARMCGVSKSTVSRALNRPEMVSAALRQKVADAARVLCYRPNPIARALHAGKRSTVMMVLPASYLFAQTELMAGCQEELHQNGHSLLTLDNSIYSQRAGEYMQVLKQQVASGVVFCFELAERNILEIQKNTPVVSFELGSPAGLFSSVTIDDYACTKLALAHLVRQGHSKIGLLPGRLGDIHSKTHITNFTRVMQELGLAVEPGWICATRNWENVSGLEAVEELFAKDGQPTALYCANGNLGQGALVGLRRRGLSVPQGMSIICAGGPSPQRLLPFSLDAVDIDYKGIGAQLATLLIEEMNGAAHEHRQALITPHALRIAGSVGPCQPG